MSLYLGSIGRKIVSFSIVNPQAEAIADCFGRRIKAVLPQYKLGATREAFRISQILYEQQAVRLNIRGDGIYFSGNLISKRIDILSNKPITLDLNERTTPEAIVNGLFRGNSLFHRTLTNSYIIQIITDAGLARLLLHFPDYLRCFKASRHKTTKHCQTFLEITHPIIEGKSRIAKYHHSSNPFSDFNINPNNPTAFISAGGLGDMLLHISMFRLIQGLSEHEFPELKNVVFYFQDKYRSLFNGQGSSPYLHFYSDFQDLFEQISSYGQIAIDFTSNIISRQVNPMDRKLSSSPFDAKLENFIVLTPYASSAINFRGYTWFGSVSRQHIYIGDQILISLAPLVHNKISQLWGRVSPQLPKRRTAQSIATEDFLEKLNENYIYIKPHSARKGKMVKAKTMAAVAQHFAKEGYTVIIDQGVNEKEARYSRKLLGKSKNILLLPTTDLHGTEIVIKRAAAFISVDTGLSHIAMQDDIQTPSLIIYSSKTYQAIWMRKGLKNIKAFIVNNDTNLSWAKKMLLKILFGKYYLNEYAGSTTAEQIIEAAENHFNPR